MAHQTRSPEPPAPRTPASRDRAHLTSQPDPILRLPNRVWLARFGSAQLDPTEANWDETLEEHESGLPPLWQQTWLETSLKWPGSKWDGARRGTPNFQQCPMVGDRVLVYRSAPHNELLGLWLVTGIQFNQRGLLRLSHRPLVRFEQPIKAKYLRDADPDIRSGWKNTFGVGARGRFLVELTDQAFFGLVRGTGINTDLFVGAVAELPESPHVVRAPRLSGATASRLVTKLDTAASADAAAFFAAVNHMFNIGCAAPDQLETDIGLAYPARGVPFTAREAKHVGRFVALAAPSNSVGPLVLDPCFVAEAQMAIDQTQEWALIVTWTGSDLAQTVYYPPQEVVRCFCPETGVQKLQLHDVFADEYE